MADNLEWVEIIGLEMWRLMDTRDKVERDTRVVLYPLDEAETIFYPTYEDSTIITLPKPEGMSIDQLKDWALNQFLLMRES